MNSEKLASILDKHQKWLNVQEGGERADLEGANLREADLEGANLEGANLQRADLQGANLREADLEGANLEGANLQRADLRVANLKGVNLRVANLKGVNLTGADLDFSCLPLWCGSFGTVVDTRIMAQLAYHLCRLECPDECKPYQSALKPLAEKFHRFEECGGLKE